MLASNVRWSPNEKKIVFTNTTANRVDVYVIDVATKLATKMNKQALNVVLGADVTWVNDHSLLYKVAVKPASAAPKNQLLLKIQLFKKTLVKLLHKNVSRFN
jgi:hypothetical protein